MKPAFALTLSFDGIVLLHRSGGGWRSVGTVDPHAGNLAADMAELLAQAQAISEDIITTKLILPNDQIRYLSIPTGNVDDTARFNLVLAALEDATPYPVDDLVFDLCPDGVDTHIAAVARETLAEAEAFAVEHGFNPVSFVSIPGDKPFLGEPFFGATGHAEHVLVPGDDVEADGIAVVVTGAWVAPEAPPPIAIETSSNLEPEQEPGGPDLAELVPEPAPDPDPPVSFSSRRRPPQADPEPVEPPEPEPAPAPDDELDDLADDGVDDQWDAADDDGFTDPSTGEDLPLADPDWVPEPPAVAPDVAPPIDELPSVAPVTIAPPSEAASRPDPALAATLRAPRPHPDLDVETPPKPARGGFLSRRKRSPPPLPERTAPVVTPVAASPGPFVDEVTDERQKLTVFGARQPATPQRGKPRHLGLILTTLLLIFLAIVALWASLFLQDELAAFWSKPEDTDLAAEPEPPTIEDVAGTSPSAVEVPTLAAPQPTAPQDVPATPDLASLPEAGALTETDEVVLDVLTDLEPEPEVIPEPEPDLTQAEVAARYAATGIWQQAPISPLSPNVGTLEEFYLTSIDRMTLGLDAVALAPTSSFETDTMLAAIPSPAAPGTAFDLDDNGLVRPTPDGAVSPDGHRVYLGRPPIVPPPTPARLEPTTETDALREALAAIRPQPRPGDLAEQSERARLGGVTREELAAIRPRARPQSAQEAQSEETPDAPPSALAVASSMMPMHRPDGLAAQPLVVETAPTRVAAVAPRVVTPSVPSSNSVARQATLNNAINLNRVNLIGVYGTPADRRALVRLPSGRYRKVQVGDRVDGGRVLAIGESELRYQKNGKNLTLTIPSG